jgi:hypothetical protein
MSWKKDYIAWYNIAVDVFGGTIPNLKDDEILRFVSKNNWLIIPMTHEVGREESIARSDPNLYFELREKGKIDVGFVCNTLESVRRMKNLLHGFHTVEKDQLIQKLRKMDEAFTTRIERKIKESHPLQTPKYQIDYEFPTNQMDDALLLEAFEQIARILEERDVLQEQNGEGWRLAPIINLAYTVIDQDENKFRAVLKQLKPIYQLVLRVKTDKAIETEIKQEYEKKLKDRQQKRKAYVEHLKNEEVSGKEFREAMERWDKENPWPKRE